MMLIPLGSLRRVALLAVLLAPACFAEIDDRRLSFEPGFSMKDKLSCVVARSSTSADVGQTITLVGLTGAEVKVQFESGARSPMKKIYETDDTMVIQLLAAMTGSVDTVVLDKTTGKFSRSTAGSLSGVYASAAVGLCR